MTRSLVRSSAETAARFIAIQERAAGRAARRRERDPEIRRARREAEARRRAHVKAYNAAKRAERVIAWERKAAEVARRLHGGGMSWREVAGIAGIGVYKLRAILRRHP